MKEPNENCSISRANASNQDGLDRKSLALV